MKQILWKEKEIEKRILNWKIIYWSSIEFYSSYFNCIKKAENLNKTNKSI